MLLGRQRLEFRRSLDFALLLGRQRLEFRRSLGFAVVLLMGRIVEEKPRFDRL